MTLAKLESITWLEDKPPAAATALADNLELFIPMAGLIDKAAEQTRLEKEIGKLEKELERSQQKLENKNYIAKAPAEVVAAEREKLTVKEEAMHKLAQQLESIKAL